MKHKTSSNSLHILFIIIIILIFNFTVSAQSKIYTLDEAINIAIANNKDITISVMNVKKAGAAVDEAFGYALSLIHI